MMCQKIGKAVVNAVGTVVLWIGLESVLAALAMGAWYLLAFDDSISLIFGGVTMFFLIVGMYAVFYTVGKRCCYKTDLRYAVLAQSFVFLLAGIVRVICCAKMSFFLPFFFFFGTHFPPLETLFALLVSGPSNHTIPDLVLYGISVLLSLLPAGFVCLGMKRRAALSDNEEE